MTELEKKLRELEIREKELIIENAEKPASFFSKVNEFITTFASALALATAIFALIQERETSETQDRIEKNQAKLDARQKLLDRDALFFWENSEIQKIDKTPTTKYPAFDLPITVAGFTDGRLAVWNQYASCLESFKSTQSVVNIHKYLTEADGYDFTTISRKAPEARKACLTYMETLKTAKK